MGMPFVNHLKAIWIKECLHCFRESRVVPPYIAAFLFCVPLKLHNFTIPYLYGYNHILTDIKRRQIILLDREQQRHGHLERDRRPIGDRVLVRV